ncbi:hypothetical protein [Micromonospora sp. NPDC005652]|uniref:hypothetical protein n=1 Tax=Micromonospora sp. NPDC005652 TaxID=3157046 RepID=UPI0033FE4C6E
MPKETIYDQVSLYDLEVGWEADRWVQVGIKTHDGRSIAEHLTGEGETPADFRGLWGSYDRAGINRLIRILRRARDSAFGADA